MRRQEGRESMCLHDRNFELTEAEPHEEGKKGRQRWAERTGGGKEGGEVGGGESPQGHSGICLWTCPHPIPNQTVSVYSYYFTYSLGGGGRWEVIPIKPYSGYDPISEGDKEGGRMPVHPDHASEEGGGGGGG